MNYIINTNTNPYQNMSLDEFALYNIQTTDEFFFLWQNQPAVIIGAHQNVYKEIDLNFLSDNNIHLVRRMSGGGAVYHDSGNINFTFIGNVTNGENEFTKYVSIIVEALKSMGLTNVELSGRNDITLNGDKISGCAKRNFNNRCMVHGTLLFNVDTSILQKVLNGPQSKLKLRGTDSVRKNVTNIADHLPQFQSVGQFIAELQRILAGNDGKQIILTSEQLNQIKQISAQKYEVKNWIYGRNIKANISYSHKFPCGTIDVDLIISNNTITDIAFCGDFIGRTLTSSLEDLLRGVEYSSDKILSAISSIQTEDYFDAMTKEQLISLIFGKYNNPQ